MAALNRPASNAFVFLTIGLAAVLCFTVWRTDYRSFFLVCNHDPGAALRTDELVGEGLRPGIDFFYYYGLFPILVSHAFFSVVGRSPGTLLILLAAFDAIFAAGLANIVSAFRPTRFGAVLASFAMIHAFAPSTPTHTLEATMLVWVVALRIRGHQTAAVALAVAAIFVKISMPTVLLAALVGLSVFDAVRLRSTRPLLSILAIPVVGAAGVLVCEWFFGAGAFAATSNPALGAAVYRAWDLGFFRAGRNFWYPAGHTVGWYVFSVAGPWLVASVVLGFVAVRAAVRMLRGPWSSSSELPARSEYLYVTMGFAHAMFIAAFFSGYVYFYTWILFVGMTPLLARAHFGSGNRASIRASSLWVITALILLASSIGPIRAFVRFVREPRVEIAGVTMPLDEADEWAATTSLARSIGHGSVTAIARTANFENVAPWMHESRSWMMLAGMRDTPSVPELVALARAADTLFVTKHDYDEMARIPAFQAMVSRSERLHDGKYFMLLRPTSDVWALPQ
jgi:hypothetical protein